jgi:hypothetical protein
MENVLSITEIHGKATRGEAFLVTPTVNSDPSHSAAFIQGQAH